MLVWIHFGETRKYTLPGTSVGGLPSCCVRTDKQGEVTGRIIANVRCEDDKPSKWISGGELIYKWLQEQQSNERGYLNSNKLNSR
jgi:hypothetical protein